MGLDTGLGPPKSAGFLLHLLKTAESSAELKGVGAGSPAKEPSQANRAPKMRRRT